MHPERLFTRIQAGHHANVRFRDLTRLATACGFVEVRVAGSHRIFVHPDVPTPLNLQDVGGKAKPYQVKQFLRLARRYALGPGGKP